jgi:putative FmdB family regulatory protein
MPIYEYLCESCDATFEKLVRRTEDVLESGCPKCGEKHLRQQYSTFAARASSPASDSSPCMPSGGGCGAGMCGTPGVCGMN